MKQARRIKKQVQDRDDWCECGNGKDRATRVSIETTKISDRTSVDVLFSILYCDDCEGIVDVISK